MDIINKFRTAFFSLNKRQYEHISRISELLALSALLAVVIRLFLFSGEKSGNGIVIAIWMICAILFGVLSVAALATKEDEE